MYPKCRKVNITDQITFKANILPHNSSAPHLFVQVLQPVDLISRAVHAGASPADRDE